MSDQQRLAVLEQACRQSEAELMVVEQLIMEPAADPLAWVDTIRQRLRNALVWSVASPEQAAYESYTAAATALQRQVVVLKKKLADAERERDEAVGPTRRDAHRRQGID